MPDPSHQEGIQSARDSYGKYGCGRLHGVQDLSRQVRREEWQLRGEPVQEFDAQAAWEGPYEVPVEVCADHAVYECDHFLSIDNFKGYCHLLLHPEMRDRLLFRNGSSFYWCVALPLSWGLSVLYFTQFMVPFVQDLRRYGYRFLEFLDALLLTPSPYGMVATNKACAKAWNKIEKLMTELGLMRHLEKGE